MSRVAGRGIQGDGKGRSWLHAGGGDSAMRGSGIGGVSGNHGIREEGGIDRTVCGSLAGEGEERGLDVEEERTVSSRRRRKGVWDSPGANGISGEGPGEFRKGTGGGRCRCSAREGGRRGRWKFVVRG